MSIHIAIDLDQDKIAQIKERDLKEILDALKSTSIISTMKKLEPYGIKIVEYHHSSECPY